LDQEGVRSAIGAGNPGKWSCTCVFFFDYVFRDILKHECMTSSFCAVFQSFWISDQKSPRGNEGLLGNSSFLNPKIWVFAQKPSGDNEGPSSDSSCLNPKFYVPPRTTWQQ